jgi:hypothetical protein
MLRPLIEVPWIYPLSISIEIFLFPPSEVLNYMLIQLPIHSIDCDNRITGFSSEMYFELIDIGQRGWRET